MPTIISKIRHILSLSVMMRLAKKRMSLLALCDTRMLVKMARTPSTKGQIENLHVTIEGLHISVNAAAIISQPIHHHSQPGPKEHLFSCSVWPFSATEVSCPIIYIHNIESRLRQSPATTAPAFSPQLAGIAATTQRSHFAPANQSNSVRLLTQWPYTLYTTQRKLSRSSERGRAATL